MNMKIRKAGYRDIDNIEIIYNKIHSAEENGFMEIGWQRDVYPVRSTAVQAFERNDLFILEENEKIVGSAIINQNQVYEYRFGKWQFDAPDNEIMVLHTLVIDPDFKDIGYGRHFVEFYEKYAKENGCTCLRIDTNARNETARKFYKKLGFSEIGCVPCTFNGINNVQLILLEKQI